MEGDSVAEKPPGDALDSNKQAQIYTACYDMDRFRRFVFESRFLDIFDISQEEIERSRPMTSPS